MRSGRMGKGTLHMSFQVAGLIEPSWTEWALVGLFPRVRLQVSLESDHDGESLGTNVTGVGTRARVDRQVLFQVVRS